MMTMNKMRARQSTRGFTLTEIAIVLGIVGLILGAIWVAAAAVYSNLRTSKATTQLLQITQNIRALYATSSNTGAGTADMTQNLISAGVFPNDTVSGTPPTATVTNAFGGSIFVSSGQAAVAGDAFAIMFNGLSQSSCISMLTANTGSGRDPGMIAAVGQNGNFTAGGTVTYNAAFAGLNVATATGLCPASTSNSDAVGFLFRLKG